jgi:uncharacterized protein YvpB
MKTFAIKSILAFCLALITACTPVAKASPELESEDALEPTGILIEIATQTQEGTGGEGDLPETSVAHEVPLEKIEATQTPTPDSVETSVPTLLVSELPDEYYIQSITGHKQFFSLGCEASAAVDWANYFGLSINETEFQSRLPSSDNPDYGFVGSVDGPWGQVPPYAYGVHAAPVAELLRQYGINAVGEKGFTIERIKAEIASGQPVIAWVIGNCVGGVPHEYVDPQGQKVKVAAYEHVVILTGYSNENGTLRYLNNGKFYDIPVEYFERSWDVLEKMVVYIGD